MLCPCAFLNKESPFRALVVAQLVERPLPTAEIRGSNPVIGKFYLVSAVIKLQKIKKKWPGMAHLKRVAFSVLGRCLLTYFD